MKFFHILIDRTNKIITLSSIGGDSWSQVGDKIPYEQVFIGKDSKNPNDDGNTILITVESQRETKTRHAVYMYIYVGSEAYIFQTPERIVKYESEIGNNDVPYPLAFTKNRVYFMTEVDVKKIKLPEQSGLQNWFKKQFDYVEWKKKHIVHKPIYCFAYLEDIPNLNASQHELYGAAYEDKISKHEFITEQLME